MTLMKNSVATGCAKRFLEFVNKTGSPYHSVATVKEMLLKADFKELRDDTTPWDIKKGGKYFLTKEGSTVCAFVVGKEVDPNSSGFVICGAHTDSPCLRLRPNTKVANNKSYVQVGIQTYGGGLWHTWFDRPLGMAGKVIIKNDKGALEEKLVRVADPIMIVPNLAIHLQTADERKAFAVNAETNLQPVLTVDIPDPTICPPADDTKTDEQKNLRHDPLLLSFIASQLNVGIAQIMDVDICLFDAEPSRFVGARDDFIYSGRIDNLVSVYAQFQGIIDFASSPPKDGQKDIAIAVAFDHEEVGSTSSAGADSSNLGNWMDQICSDLKFPHAKHAQMRNRSIFFSIDGAHGLHPNYMGKHQTEHRPILHQGIVIKTNANQRYATTPITASVFREICAKADAKVQDFVVRNDSPCGSTIGPCISSKLGMRSIDVGIPQWAMHSAKETCSSRDIEDLEKFCRTAFGVFRAIDQTIAKI